VEKDKLFILEKSLDNNRIQLVYIKCSNEELKESYIRYEFIRYSVNSIPVFKDNTKEQK